jgi:hypothetical protein
MMVLCLRCGRMASVCPNLDEWRWYRILACRGERGGGVVASLLTAHDCAVIGWCLSSSLPPTAVAHVTARQARGASKKKNCIIMYVTRIIVHRVCWDPLLPVQARLWPPDDFSGDSTPPKFSVFLWQ